MESLLSFLLYFKAFHIVGFVAWFAGLFYLVRLFVYHAEAKDKSNPEREILERQFAIMEWRVYKIICNPAMMITFTFGTLMLIANPAYLKLPWMHIKLALVVLLLVYHLYCKGIIKKLEGGASPFTSYQLRLLNEVPTLFLLSIVLLAVLRDSLNFLYAFAGILIFGFLLFGIVRMYKRNREQ